MLMVTVAGLSASYTSGFFFHDDEDPRAKTFPDIVQRLVRASRERLRPLKTFRVDMHPSLEYWYEVEVLLPGAETCRIYEHPRMVYRCEMKVPKNLPAKAVYGDVVKDVQAGLGSTDWTTHSSSDRREITRFEPVDPRRNPEIEVRLSGSKTKPTVEFLLYATPIL
jgi:hypothetical protein